jgi:hypothetical protein
MLNCGTTDVLFHSKIVSLKFIKSCSFNFLSVSVFIVMFIFFYFSNI